MYDLGRVLDEHVPVFPGRYFRQTLVTTAHHVNRRRARRQPTSTGSPSRSRARSRSAPTSTPCATCRSAIAATTAGAFAELAGTAGVKRLGVETVPQIVTRGWLVDVAPLEPRRGDRRARHRLRRPVTRCCSTPAGARTGTTPSTYLSGEPGPGLELASWLVERGVALTGCDTWSYGPVPAEDPERPFEVPQFLNARHGVFVVENLDTSELARDGVREFALILTHPKLRGATGRGPRRSRSSMETRPWSTTT